MVSVPPTFLILALPHAGDGVIPALLPLGGLTLVRRLLAGLETIDPAPVHVLAAPGSVPALEREVGDRGQVLEVPSASRLGALAAALEVLGSDLPEDAPLLIHEAERALTPASTVQAVLDGLGPDIDAVVPGIDVTDSVKRLGRQGLRNVDRSALRTLQCPRVLRRALLAQLLTARDRDPELPDDEIGAALRLGARVHCVPGSHQGAAVVDRLGLWQAQIALGLARDTSRAPGRPDARSAAV